MDAGNRPLCEQKCAETARRQQVRCEAAGAQIRWLTRSPLCASTASVCSVILIVINKQAGHDEEIRLYAKTLGVPLIETSARVGTNADSALLAIGSEMEQQG